MKSLELTDENIERVQKRTDSIFYEGKNIQIAVKQALEEERMTVDTFTVRITHEGWSHTAEEVRGALVSPDRYFLVGGIIKRITVEPA